MSWIALRITPETNRDGVIAALFEAGSQGVQEDGVSLVTHFPPMSQIDWVRQSVMAADPGAYIAISEAPEVDYSEWRAAVSARRVGDLVIAPPWLAAEFDRETTVIVDPAMAFGTGEHATTRGVLRLMQGFGRSESESDTVDKKESETTRENESDTVDRKESETTRENESDAVAGGPPEPIARDGSLRSANQICQDKLVGDLGAGSAVLSIAAAKLGASRVVAIEIDHDAIGNAEGNIAANGVGDRVEIIEGDAGVLLPLLAPVGVVLANIISSVLIPLLPTIRGSLDAHGRAILSGILRDERDEMLAALDADGWKIEREDTEDAWWSVLIAPR
ncbi:MAG: 50S ribosomal protein L11 methyltransferase [Gemmatimonadaceae bacterium]